VTVEAVRQEVRKITGRRGSYWTALGLTTAVSLAIAVIAVIVWQVRDDVDSVAGKDALDMQLIVPQLAAILMIMVAAQTGSWDVANGTFRYLALTGAPRWRLYLTRVPAVLIVALVVLVPAWIIAFLQCFVVPIDQGERASLTDVTGFLWEGVVTVMAWSLISLGVGAVFKSNGAAISFAVGAYLGGITLAALISIWRESLAVLLPNIAIIRVTGDAEEFSLAAAIVVTVAWTAGLVALGGARTVQSEY
jgi:hypothetical protein